MHWLAAVMYCRSLLYGAVNASVTLDFSPEADEDRSGTVSWDEFINIAGMRHCAS
jgi:hypothetical protein